MGHNKAVYFQKSTNNEFRKDSAGNLYITSDENKIICIAGFEEGDYGIWVEKKPPYYIEDGQIVRTMTGTKAPIEDVLNEEQNKWLDEEERIDGDFLWIHAGETIHLPGEEEEAESSHTTSSQSNKDSGQANGQENNDSSNQGDSNSSVSSSGGSGGKFYVCDGAKLECSMGTEESDLKVIDTAKIYIKGNPMATIMDYKPMVNIKPFGKCKSMANPTVAAATAANYGNLKKMPCVPNIVAPWTGGKSNVKITKIATLLESSKLMCVWAGNIKVTDPGQDLVKG